MNELTLLGSVAGPRALNLPVKMSFGQWKEVGAALHACGSATKWWYGDWVIQGEEMFKDKAIQVAADILGIDPATMTTVVSVCKAFPMDRRRALSFEHHREVYALPHDQQNKWLDAAVLQEWTKQELRDHMGTSGVKKKAAPRRGKGQKVPTAELYSNLKEEIAFAMEMVPNTIELCCGLKPAPARSDLEILHESLFKTIEGLDKVLDTVEGILAVEEKAA